MSLKKNNHKVLKIVNNVLYDEYNVHALFFMEKIRKERVKSSTQILHKNVTIIFF